MYSCSSFRVTGGKYLRGSFGYDSRRSIDFAWPFSKRSVFVLYMALPAICARPMDTSQTEA